MKAKTQSIYAFAAALACAAMTQAATVEFKFDSDPADKPRFDPIGKACLDHLAKADVVLAILDGPDADSGTCFEAGWAVARGIPVIGLRTDWRPAEDGAANCMLTRTCRAVERSLDAAIAAVESATSLRGKTSH